MSSENYTSRWWGYLYDQMMADGLDEWLVTNRQFYAASLKDIHGPVLECACGTGLFLLPFLQAGCDIYGFDISEAMLDTLRKKAVGLGLTDIAQRISVQDFETFHYDRLFGAVIIPTNSFGHLLTQEAQIRTLKNIHAHLRPGGKLLLDLRLPAMDEIANPGTVEGSWYSWTHPETGLPIRQRLVGRSDFDNQVIVDHCYIAYEDQTEDFQMTGRWFLKSEFQLLLQMSGFSQWQAFGSPEKDPLVMKLDTTYSYWVAEK